MYLQDTNDKQQGLRQVTRDEFKFKPAKSSMELGR